MLKQIVTADLATRKIRCKKCNTLATIKRKRCKCGAVKVRHAVTYYDVIGQLGEWKVEKNKR